MHSSARLILAVGPLFRMALHRTDEQNKISVGASAVLPLADITASTGDSWPPTGTSSLGRR
jgi:hypothetical protein